MIPAVSSNDPSSFANDSQIKAKSIHLDLKVDFNTRIISGFASIKFVTLISGNSIILDSSFLDIKSVSLNDGTILNFTVHDRQGFLGSPFEISHSFAANSSFEIKIVYATTSGCTAIQWLDPISTAGKKHPYLFSQCQAIHARSLLPCQDSPNIKIKYTASVTVDSKYRALMSAIQTGIEELGIVTRYSFSQDISIPSYLIAIAVGNIKGIKVGPRTTVWSEPEVVESAAWEFRDTEKFISTGESFLSPYCWGIYDLLLLPSSFPYGGMENPCLTFVTPSLLAGDRSLVDVVAQYYNFNIVKSHILGLGI